MIIEGNDFVTKYFEEETGFRCEIVGRNHVDRGYGEGINHDEAFDHALTDYRTRRESREDDFVKKLRQQWARENREASSIASCVRYRLETV